MTQAFTQTAFTNTTQANPKLPTLPTGWPIGSYASYEEAQRAVRGDVLRRHAWPPRLRLHQPPGRPPLRRAQPAPHRRARPRTAGQPGGEDPAGNKLATHRWTRPSRGPREIRRGALFLA